MALSQYRWSTAVKLALPLLVVMAIAAAPGVSGAAQLELQDDLLELGETAPVAKAGRGRFLANFDDSIPGSARRLLNFPVNLCSSPPLYTSCNQSPIGRLMQNPQCCKDTFGNQNCVDFAKDNFNCGSCGNKCGFLQQCCNGACKTIFGTDTNNCGSCGRVCAPGRTCFNGICGYNGKPF